MAQGTQPNTERNEKLVQDYTDGMNIPLLLAKYDLSQKRLYEIINRAGVEKRRKRKPQEHVEGGEN